MELWLTLKAASDQGVITAAVLSGNRNFEGATTGGVAGKRISPSISLKENMCRDIHSYIYIYIYMYIYIYIYLYM